MPLSKQFIIIKIYNNTFFAQNTQSQMSYYYSRVRQDLQRSRKYAEQTQLLEARRPRRILQALDQQEEFKRFALAEKIRADRQYQEYVLRRQTQKKLLQTEYLREREIRQQQLRDQQLLLEVERRSRVVREEELDRQRLVRVEEETKRAEFLAASRKVQLQTKIKIQDELTRQNILIREEQLQQQKLEAELKTIDVEIGTIFDQRQARRQAELEQLQILDQKIFKVKQEMRASKIKQTALQDSLNVLSKIIVPGAR